MKDIFLKYGKIKKNINIPKKEEILSTEKDRKNNFFLYQLVYTHENIDLNLLIEKQIEKDENCFFRNISYFFTHEENYHIFFRDLLYNYILNNIQDIIVTFPQIEVNDIITETKEYIPEISKNGNFAGFFEIGQIIKVIKINIAIYRLTFDNLKKFYYYEFIAYFKEDNTEFQRDLMILLYNHKEKHFTQLIYNKNYIKNFNEDNKDKSQIIKYESKNLKNNQEIKYDQFNSINNYKEKENDKENLILDIKNLILKYSKLSLKDNDNTDFELKEKNDSLSFEQKLKLG